MNLELFRIGFLPISLFDILDIAAVSFVFYTLYRYFQNTRAGQMLVGLVLLLVLTLVARLLNMNAFSWLMRQVQTVWVVAFVILFQPELRRMLIYIGQTPVIRGIFRVSGSRTIDAVVDSSLELASRKWGGLMVLQRDSGLRSYKEKGMPLRAEVSKELLVSIFNPGSPLHDGAVVIQNEIVEAAQCILPLSESDTLGPDMGTRHRAALGLTEESDAIVVVVSEETGQISLAIDGHFNRNLDESDLRGQLNKYIFVSSGE
ncbi:MAG: TIGR00159 family protein [Candidatus Marinimicrobia bacterium]|nr:TIGR00159 family protein [Candidatus Neomarinimicrobiota bacterium]